MMLQPGGSEDGLELVDVARFCFDPQKHDGRIKTNEVPTKGFSLSVPD
jgi:hypothetical protein